MNSAFLSLIWLLVFALSCSFVWDASHQDRTSGQFTLTFLRWMKAFKCVWFWKAHHIILFERESDQLKFEGYGLCLVIFCITVCFNHFNFSWDWLGKFLFWCLDFRYQCTVLFFKGKIVFFIIGIKCQLKCECLCYVLRRSVSAVWSESLKVAMHQIHQCVVIKSCLTDCTYILKHLLTILEIKDHLSSQPLPRKLQGTAD